MSRQTPFSSSLDLTLRKNAQTIYANKLIREQAFLNGTNKNLYSRPTNKDYSNYITTLVGGVQINYDISNEDRLILIANAGPIELPGAPTNVTAVANNGQCVVSWSASPFIQFPVTSYVVTSSPEGFTATTSGTSATVTGLTNGTGYTFTVVAINDIGQSPTSAASASVTPSSTAPIVSSTSFVQNTDNNATTVVFTGSIINNGGATITAMGMVYANSTPPTLADTVIVYTPTLQSGSFTIGPGVFFGSGPTYARTYATNSVGTTYGNILNLNISICLAKGTLITLLNGLKKAIENILYTDILMVWDFDNGLFAEATPLWIKKVETTTQYNLLKFSDRSTLKTINQHRIFNKEKGMFTYPMTEDTPIGTTTFNADGNEVTLTSKEIVVEEVDYYNIITSRHMNLFANSILTSCRYNNIYPIAAMKFVKKERAIVPRSVYSSIPDIYYDGLRLSEQVISVEDTINYVNNIESLKV